MPSATRLDFSKKDLQGQSFRGQTLTGANFSHADIRGADFTDAKLIGANFTHARAGLRTWWKLVLFVLLVFLAGVGGVTSGLSSVILARLFLPQYLATYTALPGVISSVAILLFFWIVVQWGLGAECAFSTATLIGAIAGLVGGFLWMSLGTSGLVIVNETGWRLAGAAAWEFAGLLLASTTLTAAKVIASNKGLVLKLAWVIGVVLAGHASWSLRSESVGKDRFGGLVILYVTIYGLMHIYISRRAWTENPRFMVIRKLAVALSTIGGTKFCGANLTDAHFTQAHLKGADFSNAHLIRTNFYLARDLSQAKVNHTILENPKIRDLAVTHFGKAQSYVGQNLKGIYLARADLRNADFTEAEISEANFVGAVLNEINLTKAQAIGTNFQRAHLTGACIEAWNIDSTTQLQDVMCSHIYLRDHQQERRPSSGSFAPGDFTELFQEMIQTIDLIFRNGVDQTAFNYSLHQLQIENEGMALSIRSLEKKSNGVVVVRVDVPAEADKTKLHANFLQHYNLALRAIEEKYQAQLYAKDEQLALYRQQQADWKAVLELLKKQEIRNQEHQRKQETRDREHQRLVILHVGEGNFTVGFPVTLQIGRQKLFRSMQYTGGRLAAAPELPALYEQWRSAYLKCLKANLRLDVPDTQVTNISRHDFLQECYQTATQLEEYFNTWLNSETFRSVKERMLRMLAPTDSIQIVLQTDDPLLRRLPFQLWEFCDCYPQAEIVLSTPDYERLPTMMASGNALKQEALDTKVNILAILGDSTGIDLQRDQAVLAQLPNTEVTFLIEPSRQLLNEQLWANPWNILFFAGHSSSQPDSNTGQIHINPHERLTIAQLKHALRQAISQGLKLAIFNSCDGLGLAYELFDLHIPQTIVMREPVPDYVAQEFLKYFLMSFSNGKPLYRAVRESREKLQGLEDRFPCATWLPVIYQNPAEPPLFWHDL